MTFRCAAASEERSESLAGSASTVSAFLLVEHPGPWGVDALRDARLPDGLGDALRERTALVCAVDPRHAGAEPVAGLPVLPALDALGATAVQPLDFVAAYAAFDNGGLAVTPRFVARVEDRAGRAAWAPAAAAPAPAVDPRVTYIMRDMMRDVVDRGTATSVRRYVPARVPVAGKTGTTNDVIALGGYVTAEDGEVLAFYFTFNGRDRWNARATIDAMGATLAGFAR